MLEQNLIDAGNIIASPKGMTRRKAIGVGGLIAAMIGLPACLPKQITPEQMQDLKVKVDAFFKDYANKTQNWDLVFGPPILRGMYDGFNDFEGHMRDALYGSRGPGVDYDVRANTPIVPSGNVFLGKIDESSIGGLRVYLRHIVDEDFMTVNVHLNETTLDRKYYNEGRPLQREILPNEIVALSGASNDGVSHLHFSLYNYDWDGRKEVKWLDPEKNGIDSDKPLFGDVKTNLDIPAEQRPYALGQTLQNLEREVSKWRRNQGYSELAGNVLELSRLMGTYDGRQAIDSKHFHDLRQYLKEHCFGIPKGPGRKGRDLGTGQIALQNPNQKRFGPGTEPYSLAMKIVGYSTDEKQKIILTLPFISPNLISEYVMPVYNKGRMLEWKAGKG